MPVHQASSGYLRSFVRRQGRITKRQQEALQRLWPHYGLSVHIESKLQLKSLPQGKDWVLEIGFGMGQSFLVMAKQYPNEHYIGVEVYRPGLGAVLAETALQGLENIRLFAEDAVDVLGQCVPNESLSRIQIFFPDPWPKTKHQKRRLVQPPFVALLAKKIKRAGLLHFATDVDCYAVHIADVMAGQSGQFDRLHDLSVLPYQRPKTKFEEAGQEKGHAITDLVYQKR